MFSPQGEITRLFNGLENINVLGNVSALISGYLGSGAQALEILENLKRVKKANKDCIYICESGDGGS